MKCVHCSTPVERKDWFCPNCRRSTRTTHPGRLGPGVLAACVGLAVVLVGVGTLAGLQLWKAQERSQTVEPSVTVQEAPRPASSPTAASPATASAPPQLNSAAVSSPAPVPSSPPAKAAGAVAAGTPAPASGGTGQVTVLADPAEKTFVYLNGGSLLGEAPLRSVPVPSGRQTLVFWTPASGGRSKRVVDVEPGGSVVVVERVRKQAQFEETAGR